MSAVATSFSWVGNSCATLGAVGRKAKSIPRWSRQISARRWRRESAYDASEVNSVAGFASQPSVFLAPLLILGPFRRGAFPEQGWGGA